MDKYDEAIAYLTINPQQIYKAWMSPNFHTAGCLFQFAGNDAKCGCLVSIRANLGFMNQAETKELTNLIRLDERIPAYPRSITVKHLPVFAEWQRRLDKELNREVSQGVS